ncbi:MAG: GNAT family N-acetyltransferase [Gammaproteobacteria bacterium]|jgi:predicted acetyltransferase|nr:GNAT family N-acetyltransferase [Gammaproteobacteria bacterium]
MPVVLRDVRHSVRGRDWFSRAQKLWLTEMGASAEDVASAAARSVALLSASDHETLLIERDDEPVGFIVLRRSFSQEHSPSYLLLEFYVIPATRTLGVGAAAARLLFDRFDGFWEIRSLSSDARAIAFWRRVVSRYAPGAVEERRERGEVVQRFLSKGAR